MKKIIFFDLDNTLHSTKHKKILDETITMLKEISKKSNIELGLATGRGENKIEMLDDLIHLFKYKVFLNGAIAYKDNKLVYNNPINKKEVINVLNYADKNKVAVGFVGKSVEYITEYSKLEDFKFTKNNIAIPEVLNNAHEVIDVYQLWLFSKNKEKVTNILENSTLRSYLWHTGGADLTDNNTNKAIAIKKVLEDETNYQLIAVGDGHNDLEMIDSADIGIAMGNSGFSELKEKADYIAPHIDDNQLYTFLKSIKIFD